MKLTKKYLPLIIMGLGGLLLALAAVWMVTGDFPFAGETAPQQYTVETLPRVSVKDAYAAFLSGNAVFLDVRGAESYVAARIPGAVNIPLDELTSRVDELSKDDWILTYCT